MDNKKELLAIALKKEKDRLPEYSMFGDKTDFDAYDKAIEYLKTGVKPINYEYNDLLAAVIEDFETVCSDYGI